jgi:hypothetical protein
MKREKRMENSISSIDLFFPYFLEIYILWERNFFFQLFFQIHVPGYTKFADRKMAISCTRVHESEKNYFRARIMFNTPKVAF